MGNKTQKAFNYVTGRKNKATSEESSMNNGETGLLVGNNNNSKLLPPTPDSPQQDIDSYSSSPSKLQKKDKRASVIIGNEQRNGSSQLLFQPPSDYHIGVSQSGTSDGGDAGDGANRPQEEKRSLFNDDTRGQHRAALVREIQELVKGRSQDDPPIASSQLVNFTIDNSYSFWESKYNIQKAAIHHDEQQIWEREKNKLIAHYDQVIKKKDADADRHLTRQKNDLEQSHQSQLRIATENHNNEVQNVRGQLSNREKHWNSVLVEHEKGWALSHDQSLTVEKAKYETQISGLNSELTQLDHRLNKEIRRQMQIVRDTISQKKEELEEQQRIYQQDFANESQRHAIAQTAVKQELGRLQQQLNRTITESETSIKQLEQDHKAKLGREAQRYAEKEAKLSRHYDDETALIQAQLMEAEAVTRLALDARDAAHKKILEEKERQQREKERKYEGQVHKLQEDVTTNQQEHAIIIQQLKAAHNEEKSRLEIKTKQEIADMKKKIQAESIRLAEEYRAREARIVHQLHESSEALLARDDEKYMSAFFSTARLQRTADEHIKTQFLAVSSLIEDLSRVEWKEDRMTWTDSMLMNLGKQNNQRILKKSIIQSCVWTILLEHVYCSPFRLFGEEGEKLEKEWAEKCSAGDEDSDPYLGNGIYTWPKPSIKTERWRYFTVYGCRETLTSRPSAYDERASLVKHFRKNLDDTTEKIEALLRKVSVVTSDTTRAIKLMIKSISNMWLEFGMNRCRLIIFLKNTKPKSIEEQITEAEKGSLTLATIPGVRRYGNEKGDDLGNTSMIEGCAGTTITISDASPV